MSRPRPSVDFGYPTGAYGCIPAYNTIEEEAAFWDRHDTSEYLGDELQPAKVTVDTELAQWLTLRLDKADHEQLARRAMAKGVGSSTLVQIWLKERLRSEADAEASHP